MTKLMEWLVAFCCTFCVWAAFVTNKIETDFTRKYFNVVLYLPIVSVILFGLYALAVVLHRTFTFNDCEDAAIELRKEIEEARDDLIKIGFKFKE